MCLYVGACMVEGLRHWWERGFSQSVVGEGQLGVCGPSDGEYGEKGLLLEEDKVTLEKGTCMYKKYWSGRWYQVLDVKMVSGKDG